MQTCILAGHSRAQAELSLLTLRMPKISVYNTNKLGLQTKVHISIVLRLNFWVWFKLK